MSPRAGLPAHAPAPPASTPGPGGHSAPQWHDAWAQALEALELDVQAAEQMITALHTGAPAPAAATAPWSPPSALPPLPASLRERAEALLGRQQAAAAGLALAATATRRQAQVAARLAGAPAPARPVFVDSSA
jgi:hypothetical protein